MDPNTIVFVFHGHRLKPDQTPKVLEIKEDGEIDVMVHQTVGSSKVA